MANQTNPTSNFNVTCNFEAIFATINDAAIIKAIANNIMTQLKQAHDARIAQLKGAATTAPTVEVAVAAPEPPKAKGKTKKEAAKEPKTAKAKTEPKARESRGHARFPERHQSSCQTKSDFRAIRRSQLCAPRRHQTAPQSTPRRVERVVESTPQRRTTRMDIPGPTRSRRGRRPWTQNRLNHHIHYLKGRRISIVSPSY